MVRNASPPLDSGLQLSVLASKVEEKQSSLQSKKVSQGTLWVGSSKSPLQFIHFIVPLTLKDPSAILVTTSPPIHH